MPCIQLGGRNIIEYKPHRSVFNALLTLFNPLPLQTHLRGREELEEALE
jgi:hypothetical protein